MVNKYVEHYFKIKKYNFICYTSDSQDETPADTSVQFCVFLVNGQTGLHTKERRTIRFWYNRDDMVDASTVASQFFQDLVLPDKFPLGSI